MPAYDWGKDYKEGWLEKIKGKIDKKLDNVEWLRNYAWEVQKIIEEEEYKKELKRLAKEETHAKREI